MTRAPNGLRRMKASIDDRRRRCVRREESISFELARTRDPHMEFDA
ncbi:hypothetical protein PLANPX_3451 [Lacipirellula parvula]|uniref:Uncharacterized protein n=1 Tax=Lacipirellula parvula TaxID=2650471 RepID=A0A5K7XLM1_9BACT|nr:hypothetical protein PLANPX_3451 [Lacipirellula parvula]